MANYTEMAEGLEMSMEEIHNVFAGNMIPPITEPTEIDILSDDADDDVMEN